MTLWRLADDRTRLTAPGRPPIWYQQQTVTGGASLTGLYAVAAGVSSGGGTGVSSAGGLVDPATVAPWAAPSDATWATLPDQNSVDFTTFHTAGSTLRATLTKIQSYLVAQGSGAGGFAQVDLPDGFDMEFADFPMAGTNKYGLYFDRVLGFRCAPGEARIRLAPMSSTVGSEGTGLRLADGRITQPLGLVPLNYGITFEGTDQPPQTYPQGGATGPQLYSGFVQYHGRGAINQRVTLRGFSQGNWNSPPGEKFSWNSLNCVDSIWRGCEVDGFNAQGRRTGSSPFGGNHSTRDVLEDCYFHDSETSGLTWSFAGSHLDMSDASTDPTTRRCRMQWNANHSVGSGKAFTGMNHENVMGAVFHYNPVVFTDAKHGGPTYLWPHNHVSIKNYLIDNTNMKFINPVWNALHPKYNGCFVVYLGKDYAGNPTGNKQRTYPLVKLGANPDGTGGTTLTPVVVTGSTAPAVTAPPTTHYVLIDP